MGANKVVDKLEKRWHAFQSSFAGLSNESMVMRGVAGGWSVKDLLGHVATWEEEVMKALPLLIEGKRTPPRFVRMICCGVS